MDGGANGRRDGVTFHGLSVVAVRCRARGDAAVAANCVRPIGTFVRFVGRKVLLPVEISAFSRRKLRVLHGDFKIFFIRFVCSICSNSFILVGYKLPLNAPFVPIKPTNV